MFYVAVVVLILTCIYLYNLLTTSSGSDFDDNSIDAFIIKDDISIKTDKHVVTSDKYKQDYTEEGQQILVLFGTEYGCSEEISKQLYDRIKELNTSDTSSSLQPRLINAKDYKIVDFNREQLCFVVISTSGDGVPPTDARPFFDFLLSTDLQLGHLKYSVLALGDSNYPQFCKTGRTVHERIGSLGAKCVIDRQDVDMEDWSIINKWIDKVINYILSAKLTTSLDYIQHGDITEELYSRTRPFMATLLVKRLLTVCYDQNDKETIHCEFDITGSDLTWTSGDALGIYPQNNPPEIEYLIKAMHCNGTEILNKPALAYQEAELTEDSGTLYQVLQKYYDLKSVKLDLVERLIDNLTDSQEKITLEKLLNNSTSKTDNALQKYLEEREVADVLVDFKSHTLALDEILSCMKSLQPRYYSISSSPKKNNNEVCITAAVVRYTTLGRSRTGVATTFINDRLEIGSTCPVFISRNPDFRLPSDSEVPVILIGPGTGIAPFIAFIQEREMETKCGPTWLYFGCRHKDKDYLYRSLLESWASKNVIRLSVAFSRDQDHKVYVQDHLKRDGNEIWHLIDKKNASIFVCGDAKHMARDVHTTLQDIVTNIGGLDEKDAAVYLQRMEESSRYQKDVWVV